MFPRPHQTPVYPDRLVILPANHRRDVGMIRQNFLHHPLPRSGNIVYVFMGVPDQMNRQTKFLRSGFRGGDPLMSLFDMNSDQKGDFPMPQ
jgi:hypothetical protein